LISSTLRSDHQQRLISLSSCHHSS
jgi:hypothetical protein